MAKDSLGGALTLQFKDYFSAHSGEYSRYRPCYPDELYDYLASIAPERRTAWDCATGNGQAAHGLAAFFQRVIATDASTSQIQNASPHERIQYRVAVAERTNIDHSSIDLATVAQALHWFNIEDFWLEVRRVLRTNGVVAVWCYNMLEISPAIDDFIREFYENVVGPYWPAERRIVEDEYRTLRFPFDEIDSPLFQMKARWSLDDLLGYLRTWSATQMFLQDRGVDPVHPLGRRILPLLEPSDQEIEVRWPLSLRVGIKHQ